MGQGMTSPCQTYSAWFGVRVCVCVCVYFQNKIFPSPCMFFQFMRNGLKYCCHFTHPYWREGGKEGREERWEGGREEGRKGRGGEELEGTIPHLTPSRVDWKFQYQQSGKAEFVGCDVLMCAVQEVRSREEETPQIVKANAATEESCDLFSPGVLQHR